MPSDTRTEPRGPRFELSLTTLVVSVFLVLVLVIAAVSLGSGYIITRRAIEADIERHRADTEQIAGLIVSSRLQGVRQLLDLTVQENALVAAMARGDLPEIGAQLTGVYFSQEEGSIDILFAHMVDSDEIVDVGTQTIATADLHEIAHDDQMFAMTDQVLAVMEEEGRRFVVLTRRDVVDAVTGRVLGSLYGGISLNDNISMLGAVMAASDALSAWLEVDGQRTTPYRAPGGGRGGEAQMAEFRSVLPIAFPEGQPVILVTEHSLRAIQELGRSYRTVTVAVVGCILLISLLAALLLRLVTQRASASLSAYVDEVNRHEDQAQFGRTAIREFNVVGQTLSRFVTAFRESDARAQTILNNASASISIKSVSGHYTFVNREFEESLGKKAQDMVGRTTAEIFPAVLAETIERNDQTVVERKTSVQFEESIDIDGVYRAYVVTKFPLTDVTGTVKSVCSIASDITPLKLSERALTHALAEAESASQAKSRFLATMSHEFRTPLNAILGFSDIIRNEYMGAAGNAAYVAYADDIYKSGHQMLELVDEILDMAAVEAGQRQFDYRPVDLVAVITDSVKQFQHLTSDKGVRLSVDLGDDLPMIHSDQRAVQQVLQNLLSNAVKFTRAGGGVRVSAHADGAHGVVVAISDTGVGMAAEVVESITEPFFQDRSDPHLAESGTGLGLSIVQSIVDAIGGRLEIESELSKGTRVTVWLPAEVDRAVG